MNNNMSKILFVISILFIFITFPLFATTIETDKITSSVNGTLSTHKGDVLSSSDPSKLQEAPWWLKLLIELIAIFVGIGIIVWQMARQHRSNLHLQKDNFKEKLHLEIYQGLIKGIDDTVNMLSKISAKSSNIPISLETYRIQATSGFSPTPPRYRALDFGEEHHALIKSVVRLFHIFERYAIAVPNFKIFQIGLNSTIYDANEAYEPFFQKLLNYLPMDVTESDQTPGTPSVRLPAIPTEEELKLIKEIGQNYNDALFEIIYFLHDLTVEAQNILLGSLFENRVPPRQPLDPNIVVITTDKESMEKLEKYFYEETAWGKNQKQLETDALSSIPKPQQD
jgi:hypothetical protein